MSKRGRIQVVAGVLLVFALLAGACGESNGSGTNGASEAGEFEAGESGDAGASPVDDEVKDDIEVCVEERTTDPTAQKALDEGDPSILSDEQIQVVLATVADCSAESLGLSGPAATCLQKSFAAAVAAYPDARALAEEVVAEGDSSKLENSVMQAALSPRVCTTEERQAMLSGLESE